MPGTPRVRSSSPRPTSEHDASHWSSGRIRNDQQNCPMKFGERLALTREDRSKYRYDREHRGWRGPVHSAPSRQTGRRYADTKASTMLISLRNVKQNQAKEATLSNTRTRNKDRTRSPVEFGDEEIDEDALSLFEFPIKETPIIRQPFNFKTGKYVNWRQPDLLHTERVKTFAFSKPTLEDNETVVSNIQAVMLKKVIDRKEADLSMLRDQLTKARTEICRLSQALDGFQCKNYSELAKENAYYKEQICRLRRENMKLLGAMLQKSNSSLKRMAESEELKRRHITQNSRSKNKTTGFLML